MLQLGHTRLVGDGGGFGAGGGFGVLTRRAGRAGGAFSAADTRPPEEAVRRGAGGGCGSGWAGTGNGGEASDRPTSVNVSEISSGTDSYQWPISRWPGIRPSLRT